MWGHLDLERENLRRLTCKPGIAKLEREYEPGGDRTYMHHRKNGVDGPSSPGE